MQGGNRVMLEKKTYKNWKEICEAMNWSTTGGDTKKKYLKQLDSMCKYHKEGFKIVIDEIFAEPKEIEDNRKGNSGRKSTYGHLIKKGIIDLYCKKGVNIMIITQKELNKIFLNYNSNIVKEVAEGLKEKYINEKGLNPKAFKAETQYITTLIEDKLFCDIWYKQITGSKFKEENFDNSVGLRLGYKIQNENGENEIEWHISDDKELLAKWKKFRDKYANEHNIKAYSFGEASMRYATNEQWGNCVKEFANTPTLSEEELKEVLKYTSAPTIQDSIEDINGMMCRGKLIAIQIVFLIAYDGEEDLSTIKLTNGELLELQLEVYKSIKKKFEANKVKRQQDKIVKKKIKYGSKEYKIKKINEVRQMFGEELLFKVIDVSGGYNK